MIHRLAFLLALALTGSAGTVASASDPSNGLVLDTRPLPADAAPDCAVRRVTGPGGAYRWDRVECESPVARTDIDQWNHGRPLAVRDVPDTDAPLKGDRYGGWMWANPADGYARSPPPPTGPPLAAYRIAGSDRDGYLAWPGKTPR